MRKSTKVIIRESCVRHIRELSIIYETIGLSLKRFFGKPKIAKTQSCAVLYKIADLI